MQLATVCGLVASTQSDTLPSGLCSCPLQLLAVIEAFELGRYSRVRGANVRKAFPHRKLTNEIPFAYLQFSFNIIFVYKFGGNTRRSKKRLNF
jgi:hypothetical protein